MDGELRPSERRDCVVVVGGVKVRPLFDRCRRRLWLQAGTQLVEGDRLGQNAVHLLGQMAA